jgi:hypothetical protein
MTKKTNKIRETYIQFKYKIEEGDELDKKEYTIHYDKTREKRSKHFRCQIAIEKLWCFCENFHNKIGHSNTGNINCQLVLYFLKIYCIRDGFIRQ